MAENNDFLKVAKRVFEIEIEAGKQLQERLGDDFKRACSLILPIGGRIIVTGIGKSGHIARKISATFTSTGTPAFFLHPSEASHGDIGFITKNDLVLAISYSGNTPELVSILPTIKLLGVPLISITGNLNSELARAANITLNIKVDKEADPCGLAPTTSTTVTLILGDALAMAVSTAKGFTSDDFARSHPGGILGKRLTKKVGDLMKTGSAIPLIDGKVSMLEAMVEMSKKRLGMVIIGSLSHYEGIFTDGDIRRAAERFKSLDTPVSLVMMENVKTIGSQVLAIEALRKMEMLKITSLVVSDEEKKVCGVIHIHDLIASGLS